MTDDRIPLPDGSSITRDEGFAAWLEMNDYLLDAEFLTFDVDRMPTQPYSAAGLDVAEADLLRRFDGLDALRADRAMFDKFIRFVGEAFVVGLGFRWTNRPAGGDDGRPYLAVEHPKLTGGQIEVPTTVTSAVARRSGTEWSFVYRNMAEDLQAAG